MSEMIAVVVIQGKPGSGPALRQRLQIAAEATHAEPGCITYALHVANDDPARFALVEVWTSEAAHAAHEDQPYVAELMAVTETLVVGPPAVAYTHALVVGDPVKGSLVSPDAVSVPP